MKRLGVLILLLVLQACNPDDEIAVNTIAISARAIDAGGSPLRNTILICTAEMPSVIKDAKELTTDTGGRFIYLLPTPTQDLTVVLKRKDDPAFIGTLRIKGGTTTDQNAGDVVLRK